MSDNKRVVLCGDDLLTCNPKDYVNIPLAMYQGSDTIGIATDDNGGYYVYQKGDRNMVDWKKPFDSFDSALEYAKSIYGDFVAYLDYLYGKDHVSESTVPVEDHEEAGNVININDYLLKSLKEVENRLDQLLEEQKRTHELLIETKSLKTAAHSIPSAARRSRQLSRKSRNRKYQNKQKHFSEG